MTFRQTVLAILGIGAIVALATAASADERRIDWKPAIAAAFGQGADVTSTLRALSNGCVEANPIYGPHPSAARLIAVKAPAVALAAWLVWRAGQPGAARWERRLSRTFGYSVGMSGGVFASWNLHACGVR